MLVYSAQSLKAFSILMETGKLVGLKDPTDELFTPKYEWMSERMRKRGYGDCDVPMWLFPERSWYERYENIPFSWEGKILISMEIPKDLILWSNHDLWSARLFSKISLEDERNLFEDIFWYSSPEDIQGTITHFLWEWVVDYEQL